MRCLQAPRATFRQRERGGAEAGAPRAEATGTSHWRRHMLPMTAAEPGAAAAVWAGVDGDGAGGADGALADELVGGAERRAAQGLLSLEVRKTTQSDVSSRMRQLS